MLFMLMLFMIRIISKLENTDSKWRYAGFISMSPSGKFVWIGDKHFVYKRDFSDVRELGFHGPEYGNECRR